MLTFFFHVFFSTGSRSQQERQRHKAAHVQKTHPHSDGGGKRSRGEEAWQESDDGSTTIT